MSDPNQPIMQSGSPFLAEQVEEVQGKFASNREMQDAISRLTLAGYDRADFSLPVPDASGGEATPNGEAQNIATDVDKRQLRTMGTGMAGYLGAAAAAGVTIATGGAAAVAVAAAAVVGAGAAATSTAGATAAVQTDDAEMDRLAAAGKLVLAVRTTDGAKSAEVLQIMREAGAIQSAPVTRREDARTVGANSSSWTG